MRNALFVALVLASATLLVAPAAALAATVDFTATLNGANERPDPNLSPGTGTATGTLTGEEGTWVFTYHVEYSGLTGPAGLGHIHDAINPGGQPFTEQFGPIIHDLDSLASRLTATGGMTTRASRSPMPSRRS